MSRNRKRRNGQFQRNRVSVEKNVHHIFPTSRYPELKWDRYNQAITPVSEHAKYHILFTNRNPYEVLDCLVDEFWNGRIDLVFEWLETRRIKTKGKQPYYEDDPLRKEDLNDTR